MPDTYDLLSRDRLIAEALDRIAALEAIVGPWTSGSGAAGVTMAANWTFAGFNWWRAGDWVQFRASATRNTSALTNSGTGNITNVDVMTFPADVRGSLNLFLPCAAGAPSGRLVGVGWNPSTGLASLASLGGDAGSPLSIGETIEFGGMFYVG